MLPDSRRFSRTPVSELRFSLIGGLVYLISLVHYDATHLDKSVVSIHQ